MWKIKIVHRIDLFVSHVVHDNKLKKTVGEAGGGRPRAQWKQADIWAAAGKFVDL